MKKMFIKLMAVVIATLCTLTTLAEDHNILPPAAKNYITRHFKGYTINHYEKERDILEVNYTVYISNANASYKLNFDKDYNITEIESKDDNYALPKSVLPVKITALVEKKFPDAKIIGWKKTKGTQIIELNNDIEIVFNAKGDFLRIDD